jgi:hypothetical protein
LSSIIYKYAYLQHTQNGLEMPWIKAVKNILDSCGFNNIWENQGNFNSKLGLFNVNLILALRSSSTSLDRTKEI